MAPDFLKIGSLAFWCKLSQNFIQKDRIYWFSIQWSVSLTLAHTLHEQYPLKNTLFRLYFSIFTIIFNNVHWLLKYSFSVHNITQINITHRTNTKFWQISNKSCKKYISSYSHTTIQIYMSHAIDWHIALASKTIFLKKLTIWLIIQNQFYSQYVLGVSYKSNLLICHSPSMNKFQ